MSTSDDPVAGGGPAPAGSAGAGAGPSGDTKTFPAKGPVGGETPVDRAEVVARLAQEIAATARSRSTAGDDADEDEPDSADPRRPRGRDGGRRSRRGADSSAPGHPEDDPGDPAVLAKAICLRLLAISARPRAGLKQSLTRKGIPDEVAETVLDRLTTVGLIDDEAYAAAFVRTKHRDRALGRAGLGQELRRKGVDPELVSAAVAEIDPTAERIRARALVDRRLAAAMAAGPLAARRRLAGLLARRGYAPAVAYEVVGQAVDAYVREMPADAGETAEWSESDDPFGDAD
ncbi:regulatory protein RecX [Nakamurella flavida]|uniref:Regulatory protein RecX n=1 Tax=Nakamurella flavida TaxID=363630 RepID=A0A938YSZ5_9ACTN|nr:regulatory protein RecX [Nakamurella flavida]MBM9478315.1 regulatory protein RecX [Nakamurella flavida]MDP9777514.1 regulatory protein [Nakamurella flavida]